MGEAARDRRPRGIDAQHRELFARIAGFDAALSRGDRAEIRATFAFLREYALVHFETEERLMREIEYPRLSIQREQHAIFKERLVELSREHEAQGESFLLRKRTENWILVWLANHVGDEDSRLGRYMAARSA